MALTNRDIITLLRNEARKKPAIAALMDQAQTMTDAEIDALKVPLPWYRKALKQIRNLNIRSDETARVSELLNNKTQIVHVNDVGFGAMRLYTGPTMFVGIGNSNGALELKTGQYVWFPESGGIWIDTIFSPKIDHALIGCIFIERNRRSAYLEKVAERRRGFEVSGITDTESRPLFRIQRN